MHHRFLFPRPCRLVKRRFSELSGQFGIGETLAHDMSYSQPEAVAIGHVLAVVVAERLLVDVAEKVKRFHAHVSTPEPALEQGPEILHPVGVNVALHVLNGVIDNGMLVVGTKAVIGFQFVSEQGRAHSNVFADLLLKFALAAIVHDHRADFPATFQHPENNSLILSAGSGDLGSPFRCVHVPRLPADESLVNFHFTGQFTTRLALECKPDTVQHEPRGFLGHAKRTVKLPRGNAILRISDQPNRRKPLIQTKRRILEDGPSLESELALRVMSGALPLPLIRQESHAGISAGRAGDTVRPAPRHHVGEAIVGVGEVDYRFPEGLWFVFHDLSVQQNHGFVKYIVALLRITDNATSGGRSKQVRRGTDHRRCMPDAIRRASGLVQTRLHPPIKVPTARAV